MIPLLQQVLQDASRTCVDILYEEVDEYDIYCHFLGREFELKELLISTLRVDNHSTLRVTQSKKTGRLYFNDFGDSRLHGGVFDYVKFYAEFNYEIVLRGIYDITRFISEEMGLGLFGTKSTTRVKKFKTKNLIDRPSYPIRFMSRPFTKLDKAYWGRLGVSEELLSYYDIRSVKYLLSLSDEILYSTKSDELAYAYVLGNYADKTGVKIYRPFAEKAFKFRNSCSPEAIFYQGLNQLEGYDTLVITKAMKDVLTFRGLIPEGIDFIAPPGEGILPDEEFFARAREIYKRIVVIYDYDGTGIKSANYLGETFGAEVMFINTETFMEDGKEKVFPKDISDLVWISGQEAALKRLRTLKLI